MNRPARKPWPWWRRVIRELVWATDMDDGNGNGSPSMTKGMAATFAVVAVIAILMGLPVDGGHLTLAVIAISAAFGRSMWRHYLARGRTKEAPDADA